MNTDGSILLKILTGPHQGAEMEVAPGTYVIGRDDSCDMILSDVMIEPKHLRLELKAGRTRITRLAGEVYVDGKLIEGQEKEIKPFQYVTLGSTYFTTGPSHEAWPPNALRSLPPLEQPAPKKLTVPVAKLNIGKTPKDGELVGAGSAPRKSHLVSTSLLVGAVVFSGLAGWMEYSDTQQVDATPAPPTLAEVQQSVDGALHKLPFSSDIKTSVEDPSIVVEGTVAHAADLRKLHVALATWRSQITIAVVSNDQLLSDTREILAALDTGLSAELSDEGRIVVSGFAGSAAHLQETQNILVHDLPGNLRLTFNVLTNEQAAETASQIVSQNGLGSVIAIDTIPTGIVASGKIDADEETAWNRVRQQISKTLPMLPDLKNTVAIEAPDTVNKNENAVDSICAGPIPWFRLHGGQTCFNGATVGGWTVTSILPDAIQVTKNGVVRSIKLGAALTQSFDPAATTPGQGYSTPFSIH